jgi:hypothetical protein
LHDSPLGQVAPSAAALQSGTHAWSPAKSMVMQTESPGQLPPELPQRALQMPAGSVPASGNEAIPRQNSLLAALQPCAPPSGRAKQAPPISPLLVVNAVGAQI